MQQLQHDSDVLEEQEFSKYPDTILTTVNSTFTSAKNFQSDLNLIINDFERGKAINRAMISIDSIRRTAVCNEEGKVFIKSLPFGTYHLDIISVGFIAQRIIINIEHSKLHEIHVRMVSNS